MHIGIDIGGTSIKGGVVDNGQILARETAKTPKDNKEFVFAVKNIIHYLLEQYPHVNGIGIGCPGPLNAEKGIILKTPNLSHNTDLGILRNDFNIPIIFNNDANCFALGEAIYGAGKAKQYVLGVTLGTGFGCGVVVRGTIFAARGNAVEIAHTIIRADEQEKLQHLVRGCVEQYVSAGALKRLAAKYDLNVEDPVSIYHVAEMKNEKALAVFKEFGRDLGIVLTNCIHSYDPDIILIGGAISQAWKYFEESMTASLEEHCMIDPCPIVRSSLSDAGIIGASLLVKDKNI